MGKQKKVRQLKLRHVAIKYTDSRLKFSGGGPVRHAKDAAAAEAADAKPARRYAADQFLEYNPNLGPPYHILLDTSFLNFTVVMKLDMIPAMIDCVYAKCIPYVTDCVMAELERHGQKFALALRLAKDPRCRRLRCDHENIGYADDCLCTRAEANRCYIVATNDVELKRRIRKIPGVPIMTVKKGKYGIERLADVEFT